ncbi:MAG: SDR family oxidoreductase [Armatimonadetes bacterium]|nr:SDR family oxidoreductase [Armatimonadota bacterium]
MTHYAASKRRNVLITGASSGIGRATALRFAEEGYNVCVNARTEEKLRGVAAQLEPGDHLVVPGDYSDPSVAQAARDAISQSWGELDALVNVAGASYPAHPIDDPLDTWRKNFDILVDGAVLMTRAAAPLMHSGGRIVHITSIHGERAERQSSAYGMAKAALNQYCRALALELADRNVLVNAIAPGFVDTRMSIVDGISELESDWFIQGYVEGRHLPLRRAGRPEEIAGVALFLCGPDATYITGQVITVDGGLTITF